VRVWALFGFDATAEWFDPAAEASERYRAWCKAQWSDEVEAEAVSWAGAIRPQLPTRWRDQEIREILRAFAENEPEVLRSVHWAGLLVFHDAFPSPDAEVGVDILNPHHRSYYSGQGRGSATPDDAENPVPVYFLVLNPGCRLTLRVSCPRQGGAIWDGLGGSWRHLLEEIAETAIQELGFGAKTRVGYGYGEVDATAAMERQKAAEERRRTEELARCPWRAHLPVLEAAADWGTFRQIVEQKLHEHLSEPEVGRAIERKAKELRRKKWGEDRDRLVRQWLGACGMDWAGGEAEARPEVSPETAAWIERIRGLSDWGAWKAAGIRIEDVPSEVLPELRKRFKEWGCDNRKAKKDKKAAWKQLEARLRSRGKR